MLSYASCTDMTAIKQKNMKPILFWKDQKGFYEDEIQHFRSARDWQHLRKTNPCTRWLPIRLPALCSQPAARCCCVQEDGRPQIFAWMTLICSWVFGKSAHVWGVMAEELMGVLIAFQSGSQQSHKLDVFSISIYHPRGVVRPEKFEHHVASARFNFSQLQKLPRPGSENRRPIWVFGWTFTDSHGEMFVEFFFFFF